MKNIKGIMILLLTLALAMVVGMPAVHAENVPEINPVFQTESDMAYTWLKTQQDSAKLDSGDLSGLVDSFEDFSGPNQPLTEAFTYDQAVAAIAFLVKGDIDRAKIVLTTLQNLQAPDGSWCNSYWYNGYWGAELRKHVGPAIWVALAVRNYEIITGDTETYHDMAVKAVDWSLQYQQPNGGVAGGETTWDVPGVWTKEVWTGTEHNIDIYPALVYFASTTPSRETVYNQAATKVKSFLDNVVWDKANNRFFGGYKNNTGLVDPFVPLDVNPWGIMALGLTDGVHDYFKALDYIENAQGDPVTGKGTLAHPRYVYTLTYNDAGDLMTGYDFDWESDDVPGDQKNGGGFYSADIWLEGSTFMAGAYYAKGDDAKGDSIMTEIAKKLGTTGASLGGLPYSLKASNNNYWRMLQQNCISSTAWFVIIASKWNPFMASPLLAEPRAEKPVFNMAAGQYPGAINVTITSATEGATIRYTLDGTTPDASSLVYEGPITISSSKELKALAFKDGIKESMVNSASYIIDAKASHPSFSLKAGTYIGEQSLIITSATNGAVIKYTLDGTMPDADSPTYVGPIIINKDTTVVAMAVRDQLQDSDYVKASYHIVPKIAAPSFNHNGGGYEDPQVIILSHPDSDAIIRYTVDGSTPTSSSPRYTGPITVSASTTIKAIAQKKGYGDSDVSEAVYTINRLGYNHGFIEDTGKVTVYFDEGATWVDIHYQLNNLGQQNVRMTDNAAKGYQDIVINNVNKGDVITYWFTFMKDGVAHDTEQATYTMGQEPEVVPTDGKVATPVVSVYGGLYNQPIQITITCSTPGAIIHYIMNNDLSKTSVIYTGPFTLDVAGTLKVYATKDGYEDSDVALTNYAFNYQPDTGVDLNDRTDPVVLPNDNVNDPENPPEDPVDPVDPKPVAGCQAAALSEVTIGLVTIISVVGLVILRKRK